MKSVILCEGKTDAVLLSYYLIKVHGWKFDRNIKMRIPVLNNTNSNQDWYKKDNDQLLILAVGGNSCFNNSIEHILKIIKLGGNDSFENILILTDRDNSVNDKFILDELSYNFKMIDSKFQLANNEWRNINIVDSFNENISINIGTIIIPFNKNGALETFLLEALSEKQDNEYIVNKVREFIPTINSNKYLSTERLKLKAELGVTFAIISPEKVFYELDKILKDIEWEKFITIQEGFRLLGEI